MRVRKTGAILLLLVAVLWAAKPAFACFAPAKTHGCCMHRMRDCDPATMQAGAACCQVRSQNESEQPAAGTSFDTRLGVAHTPVLIPAALKPVSLIAVPLGTETPPPLPAGDAFILRI